jgi:hypothetical protein
MCLIRYLINYNNILLIYKYFIALHLKMVGDTKFSSPDLSLNIKIDYNHIVFFKSKVIIVFN